MGSDCKQSPTNEEIEGIIRLKAKALSRSRGFHESEYEDIQQDLHLHWLEHRAGYKSARGNPLTFADIVLNNKIRSMIRARRAGKRDYRRNAYSLDDPLESDGQIKGTRHEIYDKDRYARQVGNETRSRLEIESTRSSIRDVLKVLPPHHRELTCRLAFQTMAEAAREMKVPRTTLYTWLEEIRAAFARAGLREDLRLIIASRDMTTIMQKVPTHR